MFIAMILLAQEIGFALGSPELTVELEIDSMLFTRGEYTANLIVRNPGNSSVLILKAGLILPWGIQEKAVNIYMQAKDIESIPVKLDIPADIHPGTYTVRGFIDYRKPGSMGVERVLTPEVRVYITNIEGALKVEIEANTTVLFPGDSIKFNITIFNRKIPNAKLKVNVELDTTSLWGTNISMNIGMTKLIEAVVKIPEAESPGNYTLRFIIDYGFHREHIPFNIMVKARPIYFDAEEASKILEAADRRLREAEKATNLGIKDGFVEIYPPELRDAFNYYEKAETLFNEKDNKTFMYARMAIEKSNTTILLISNAYLEVLEREISTREDDVERLINMSVSGRHLTDVTQALEMVKDHYEKARSYFLSYRFEEGRNEALNALEGLKVVDKLIIKAWDSHQHETGFVSVIWFSASLLIILILLYLSISILANRSRLTPQGSTL